MGFSSGNRVNCYAALEKADQELQRGFDFAHCHNLVEAEKAFRRSWQIRRQNLGPEDLTTLTSQLYLAWALNGLQQNEESEYLMMQGSHISGKILGRQHRATLSDEYFLALWLFDQKNYGAAKQVLEKNVRSRRQALGPEDPHTLDSENKLAATLKKMERYEEAESAWRWLFESRSLTFGPESPHTLSSEFQLAQTLHAMGRYGEAVRLSQQNLETRRRVFGENDIDTLWAAVLLSSSYFNSEQYDNALPLMFDIFSKLGELSDDNRRRIEGIAKQNLAETLFEKGLDDQAYELFHELIQDTPFMKHRHDEVLVKLHLTILNLNRTPSNPLPLGSGTLLTHLETSRCGKRFLRMIESSGALQKCKTLSEALDALLLDQGTISVFQESGAFLKDFVDKSRPANLIIETEISTIEDDGLLPTTLTLDIYCDKPNQTSILTRTAHLDTKASADFVSSELVELLGHATEIYNGPSISTGGGRAKPVGQVSLFFEWRKSGKIRKRSFLIMDDLPYDLILGIRFITEFEVYSVGSSLLVMQLSPLNEDERKQLKARAARNRQRREAEEKAEEDRNRAIRREQMRAQQARASASNAATQTRDVNGSI